MCWFWRMCLCARSISERPVILEFFVGQFKKYNFLFVSVYIQDVLDCPFFSDSRFDSRMRCSTFLCVLQKPWFQFQGRVRASGQRLCSRDVYFLFNVQPIMLVSLDNWFPALPPQQQLPSTVPSLSFSLTRTACSKIKRAHTNVRALMKNKKKSKTKR